jgi:putative nucleotidyltransferase with HDIG domain
MLEREKAAAMVGEAVTAPQIVSHMLATEAAMRALARRLGEDEDVWGLTGLLHDLDYERTKDEPGRHGRATVEMLAAYDVPAELLDAILAHNGHVAAGTPLARALVAADPATGFVVAATLMHPARKLAACDVTFLMKRFREKRFAAGASREQMATCGALGLTVEEFLGVCRDGMVGAAEVLGL